jgi:hypothetical protein
METSPLPVKSCKFRPMLSTQGFWAGNLSPEVATLRSTKWACERRPLVEIVEQGEILIVPHLLWHGTSVFPVSSEGFVRHLCPPWTYIIGCTSLYFEHEWKCKLLEFFEIQGALKMSPSYQKTEIDLDILMKNLSQIFLNPDPHEYRIVKIFIHNLFYVLNFVLNTENVWKLKYSKGDPARSGPDFATHFTNHLLGSSLTFW